MTGVVILNVDDTEGALYAKHRTLRHAGYEVVDASTGGEALRPDGNPAARAGAARRAPARHQRHRGVQDHQAALATDDGAADVGHLHRCSRPGARPRGRRRCLPDPADRCRRAGGVGACAAAPVRGRAGHAPGQRRPRGPHHRAHARSAPGQREADRADRAARARRGRAGAVAEDGGGGPAHRLDRARLQQHPGLDDGLDPFGAAQEPRPRHRRHAGQGAQCGRSRQAADVAAAGVLAQRCAGHRLGRGARTAAGHARVADPDRGQRHPARDRGRRGDPGGGDRRQPARAGVAQSGDQRARCHACRRSHPGRVGHAPPRPSRRRPDAGRLRDGGGARHRHRHGARCGVEGVRSVFHHQAGRARHRPWPGAGGQRGTLVRRHGTHSTADPTRAPR